MPSTCSTSPPRWRSPQAVARSGTRLPGDLVFFAVADEEAGSAYEPVDGRHHPDVVTTDYLLTENSGLHVGSERDPAITMVVGEKGRLASAPVRGTPGHGSARTVRTMRW